MAAPGLGAGHSGKTKTTGCAPLRGPCLVGRADLGAGGSATWSECAHALALRTPPVQGGGAPTHGRQSGNAAEEASLTGVGGLQSAPEKGRVSSAGRTVSRGRGADGRLTGAGRMHVGAGQGSLGSQCRPEGAGGRVWGLTSISLVGPEGRQPRLTAEIDGRDLRPGWRPDSAPRDLSSARLQPDLGACLAV